MYLVDRNHNVEGKLHNPFKSRSVHSTVLALHARSLPRPFTSPCRWSGRALTLVLAAVANACAHPVFDDRVKELRGREIVSNALFPHSAFAREYREDVPQGVETIQTGDGYSDPLQRIGVYRAIAVRLFNTRSIFEGRRVQGQANDSSIQFFRYKWRFFQELRYPGLSKLSIFLCTFFWCRSIYYSWFVALFVSSIVVTYAIFGFPRLSARRSRAE